MALTECVELISIFVKSIETAKKNMNEERKSKLKNKRNEK